MTRDNTHNDDDEMHDFNAVIIAIVAFVSVFGIIGCIIAISFMTKPNNINAKHFDEKIMNYQNYCFDDKCIEIICLINIENKYSIYRNKCPFPHQYNHSLAVFISNQNNDKPTYSLEKQNSQSRTLTDEEIHNLLNTIKTSYELIDCQIYKGYICKNSGKNRFMLHDTTDEQIVWNEKPEYLIDKQWKEIMNICLMILIMIISTIIYFYNFGTTTCSYFGSICILVPMLFIGYEIFCFVSQF